MRNNLYLIGFSGSGKSSAGRYASQSLGWVFVDTDQEIVNRSNAGIDSIFNSVGESGFREVEHEVLKTISQGNHQVVSTGGGIVTDERNWEFMKESGFVVCLEARPNTIINRISSAESKVIRPMLDSTHENRGIEELKAERQHLYALADWTVHTDQLTLEETAAEIIRAFQTLMIQDHIQSSSSDDSDLASIVRTNSGHYPIWVTWDGLSSVGERVRKLADPETAYVIADEGSNPYARRVQASLEAAGIAAHSFIIPAGEATKTLQTVELVYRWLANRRAQRDHAIVAVGGGVVGDLAGYVAATFLRGINFVQIPTTLLAMVDSSVGGKTGVDMQQGKNLVGAFHQPQFVLADIATLKTLAPRILTEGWAEVIKHALAFEPGLLADIEQNVEPLKRISADLTTELIKRSVAIKAEVVSRDEHERLGFRILLNYGHTLGHALESVTSYDRYLHGEAVSIGMMAAGHIALNLGMLTEDELTRQRLVLEAYDLPTTATGVEVDALRSAMLSDKKVKRNRIRWILLDGIGNAVVHEEVPDELIEKGIRAVVLT